MSFASSVKNKYQVTAAPVKEEHVTGKPKRDQEILNV